MASGDVPVAPLRDAFERSGITSIELAKRLGWFTGGNDPKPDGSRVVRTLGIKPSGKGSKPVTRSLEDKMVSYDNAVLLADALGLDPVDVGV